MHTRTPHDGSLRRIILGLALVAATCSPAPEARKPNVVLVVIDTLRADKLGCYGGTRGLTPHIDAFARDAVLFENASAHAPWTLPSIASMLTSQTPAEHGAGGRLPEFTQLPDSAATLAEVFASSGYRTALVANVAFLGAEFGLTQGFEFTDVRAQESNDALRRAAQTSADALAWIDSIGDEPFFVLVHYFDPHALYDPPQPFRARFAEPPDRDSGQQAFGSREDIVRLRTGGAAPDASAIRRAEALYDGEVAYTDDSLGIFLDGLDSRGLRGRTIVAITSDHGEEFLEHGGFEHGHSHHSELLDVPLLVSAPGVAAGRRDTRNVGLIDLAPTLCALAQTRSPSSFRGRALVDVRGQPANEHASMQLAFGNFWGPPLASLRDDQHKLIVHPRSDGKAAELFEWRADRSELADVAALQKERAIQLQRALKAALEFAEGSREGKPAAAELSEAQRKALGELGYTELRR